jgi:hypothetical protein
MRKLRTTLHSFFAPTFGWALRLRGAVPGIPIAVEDSAAVTRTDRLAQRVSRRYRASTIVAGASLGIAAAGLAMPAHAQTAEEACAFASSLRSVDTVSRVLSQFPNDACVPAMLTEIPPRVLSRLSPELVAGLPRNVLQYFPAEILAEFGISVGSTRSIADYDGPY